MGKLHCPTCTCSALWEITTHHLVQVGQLALGVGLGLGLGALLLTRLWLAPAARL